jgi:phosphonate transport system substrate-binding protein
MTGRRHVLAAFAMLLAGRAGLAAANGPALLLGVLPVMPARHLVHRYLPLSSYLEGALGIPVAVETTHDFPAFYARLAEGGFDLAAFAPHIARLAQMDLGWIPLVQFKPDGSSQLVSLREGAIATLSGLRGKNISVLDRTALVVLVMLGALEQQGMNEGRDFTLVETRSHESAVRTLETGEAQAMITRGEGFLGLATRARLRVIHEVGGVPGWVVMAAPGLDPALRERARQALLKFNTSPQSFQFFSQHGYRFFAPAEENDLRAMDALVPVTRMLMKGGPA